MYVLLYHYYSILYTIQFSDFFSFSFRNWLLIISMKLGADVTHLLNLTIQTFHYSRNRNNLTYCDKQLFFFHFCLFLKLKRKLLDLPAPHFHRKYWITSTVFLQVDKMLYHHFVSCHKCTCSFIFYLVCHSKFSLITQVRICWIV